VDASRTEILSTRVRVLVGLASFGVGCTAPHVVKPQPPDLSGLVASYESPGADFDPSLASDVQVALGAASALLAQTQITPQLTALFGDLVQPLATDGSSAAKLALTADGYLTVTRICPGWTLPPVADAAQNGSFDATATFSERGLDPVAWGTLSACRYLVGQSQLELTALPGRDVALSVYWGQDADPDALTERTLLFSLGLGAVLDGTALSLDLDFRLLQGGAVEYRLEPELGSLIVRVATDRSVVLRARNGTFACTESLDCSAQVGDAGSPAGG
jgi:hypothetical protein